MTNLYNYKIHTKSAQFIFLVFVTKSTFLQEHKCDVMYSPATSISSEHLNWTFFLKVKPRDIAHQMTQIDFEKFSKIKVSLVCDI